MAALKIRFDILDRVSDAMDGMARAGENVTERFERTENAVNSALNGITQTVTIATSSIDNTSSAIESLQSTADRAVSSAEALTDSMGGYNAAADEAISQTDYWTNAANGYSKSALEAVYSTEELVEMGYKSADALDAQNEMFALCEQSADSLNKSVTAATPLQEELSEALGKASQAAGSLSDNESVSAETKEALAKASSEAETAMIELQEAQQKASEAMDNYNSVMESGTTDLDTLEKTAEQAGWAAEDLATANEKAANAAEILSRETQAATEEAGKSAEETKNVSDEADKCGKIGLDAIESIAGALASVGITAKLKEISEEAYGLVTAFSDAESTVVLATGAAGDALDGLTKSMTDAYSVSRTGSLDETAAAVGEINTRLGYTDNQLTETTGLFLDFAAVTGGNAASSVRSVTQLMNRWNVPAENMEEILSKLTYAGQASVISVSS